VRVRIGLHHGRPQLTETGYVGIAVHTTARVCSAGHGGQILVSRVAREALELVEAQRPTRTRRQPKVEFRLVGRYQLAGLHRPEALYQIVAAGMKADFPALRASRVAEAEGPGGAV
jgi:class 3 adenylate cyclase